MRVPPQRPSSSGPLSRWPDVSCSPLSSASSLDLFASSPPVMLSQSKSSLSQSNLDLGHLLRGERLEVGRVLGVGLPTGRTQTVPFRPEFVPTETTNLNMECKDWVGALGPS